MEISVVIPSKDRLKSLERVLPSYFDQVGVREVIIVIDGSTDGTQDYLKNLVLRQPKLKVLENDHNRGPQYSKNRGVKSAKYDYIFIGEDDLELTDNFFVKLMEHKKCLGVDLIVGRCIWRFDNENADDAIRRVSKMKGKYINLKSIEINSNLPHENDEVCTMTTAPILGESAIFKEIKFDERYKVNYWREETDFQFSAQEAGYTIGRCPHAICYNYIIRQDRGGVYASLGWKRAKWVIINNWKFINRHKEFIKNNFSIGNQYIYIIKFSIKRFVIDVVIPMLSFIKRKLINFQY